MSKVVINHVLSNNVKSMIFESILNYHHKYSDKSHQIITSVKPVDNADVYVYHRPHLEHKLAGNSIAIVHHDLNEFESCFRLERFISRYREAKYVVCLNHTQESILQGNGLTNIKLIPHGYNDDIFKAMVSPKKVHDNGKITLGILSRHYPRGVKGESSVIEIAKRLPITDFKFILIGEGRDILNSKLMSLGFDSEFINFLPYYQYADVYHRIDFLLITSFYEGGPASIPEAIVTGTPVITTPVGMANDLISHNYNGVILSGTYDNYAQSIIRSCSARTYNQLAVNTLLTKKHVLTWKNVVNQYSEMYEGILNERK